MPKGLMLLAVAASGAAGTLMRYGVARLFARRGRRPEHATLTVNLLGAALLGLLLGGAQPSSGWSELYVLLGGSLLGGLTTMSTLMLQLAGLTERRAYSKLWVYAGQTFLLGVPLAGIGWRAGAWLAGG